MSDPKPKYTLTDDELRELLGCQSQQEVEAFFEAMPAERAKAILSSAMMGASLISVAPQLVEFLQQSSGSAPTGHGDDSDPFPTRLIPPSGRGKQA